MKEDINSTNKKYLETLRSEIKKGLISRYEIVRLLVRLEII